MRALIRANAALLFTGIATFIVLGAGQSVYGPALPAFARLYDLSLGVAGMLITAHWVGCALGVGLMFWLGPRATPRHVLIALTLGAGIVASGGFFALALLGAVIFGAGYGAATVVFNSRALLVFGPRGTAILSLFNACFGIGAIGAPLLFVWLNNAPSPTFTAIAFAAAAIFVLTRPDGRAVSAAPVSAPFNLHMPILTFHALAIGTEACLIGLGPAALINAGATEVWAAQLLSIFFIGFLIARIALVFVAHIFAPLSLAILAAAGTGLASMGAATLSPDLFFVIMGFCAGAYFPTIYVAATLIMGNSPRVSPTIITAGLIGGIAMPLLLSPMMVHLGQRGFFWIFAALLIAMAVTASVARARLP